MNNMMREMAGICGRKGVLTWASGFQIGKAAAKNCGGWVQSSRNKLCKRTGQVQKLADVSDINGGSSYPMVILGNRLGWET